jgi:hypothetical protein
VPYWDFFKRCVTVHFAQRTPFVESVVVREADPSLAAEAIRARHKEFDELWSLAVKSVRRAHGAWATNWALQQMGRDEDMRLVDEELPPREGSSPI